MTVIGLTMACAVFSATILPTCQAVEKFKIRDNFLSLVDVLTYNWTRGLSRNLCMALDLGV